LPPGDARSRLVPREPGEAQDPRPVLTRPEEPVANEGEGRAVAHGDDWASSRTIPIAFAYAAAAAVRCGVELSAVLELSREQREDLLADVTCAALEALRPDASALIQRVRAELAVARRNLAVVYFTKETQHYEVRVLHHLHPLREGPLAPIGPAHTYFATLEYRDRDTGFVGRTKLFDFNGYDEIYGAIGSISVDADTIRVKPRRGDHFNVPLETAISSLTSD
jgi:hypothetical protein